MMILKMMVKRIKKKVKIKISKRKERKCPGIKILQKISISQLANLSCRKCLMILKEMFMKR